MKSIFEDRTTYSPDTDPVATIALTVECSPGQVDSLTDYLAEVCKQAGVYAAALGCDIHIPARQVVTQGAEAVEQVRHDVAEVQEQIVSTFAAPEQPAPEELKPEGEAHGEQAIQQPDLEPQAAEVGPGSEAPAGGEPEPVDDGAHSELAEPAGEVGTGEIERSP